MEIWEFVDNKLKKSRGLKLPMLLSYSLRERYRMGAMEGYTCGPMVFLSCFVYAIPKTDTLYFPPHCLGPSIYNPSIMLGWQGDGQNKSN